MSAYGARANFAAAQRNYDAMTPEHDDIGERVDARIEQLSADEWMDYMRKFCESNSQLACETTDGKWVTSRKSLEELWLSWLGDRIQAVIEREERA